ncbi:winged helix-turn-helix transcriptional regulator [Streptomyces liliifuscus]|uniref:Helix-turn-helix transcriptional regulator n=1 Tax=Streptomyces liliifuscus TaxID=2797636 RepID=A0A7T7I3J1_9ACTN|nr:helix-turn-helix domain-containing protein [Streptomyces liliifuscus]QQM40282.1 helix-turn-helix transcriptional regulator [Streptomyces liliifuscus]
MRRKEFGQYCGLARALELIGERWALLVIRELLARPGRYTDLLEDLPGIPTNVLSTRLKELEEAGIVERRIAPAPQRGVVYALTKEGEGLEAAVLTLARWGNTQLGEHQPGDLVPPSSLVMGLRATFNRDAASGLTASWELRAAEVVLHAVVTDGHLTSGVGPAPTEPDLVVTIAADAVPTYREIMQAIKSGEVELSGPKSLLATFARVFTPQST